MKASCECVWRILHTFSRRKSFLYHRAVIFSVYPIPLSFLPPFFRIFCIRLIVTRCECFFRGNRIEVVFFPSLTCAMNFSLLASHLSFFFFDLLTIFTHFLWHGKAKSTSGAIIVFVSGKMYFVTFRFLSLSLSSPLLTSHFLSCATSKQNETKRSIENIFLCVCFLGKTIFSGIFASLHSLTSSRLVLCTSFPIL